MDLVRSLPLGITASIVPFAIFGVTGRFGWWTSVTVGLVGATLGIAAVRMVRHGRGTELSVGGHGPQRSEQ